MQQAILKESEYFYQFQNNPQNITAIFTNRKLNTGFKNQTSSQVKKNRAVILSALGIRPKELTCARQTHEDNVYIVQQKDKGKGAFSYESAIQNTDALITKEKNIALAVFTADCLPIFLIDKTKNIIGLVHAGWRGTKKAIVKNTIFVMNQAFESEPKDITAYFGPSIRRCCYEVGKEFLNYFKRGIYQKKNKIFFDLMEVNHLQLKEVGVQEENIFDSEICTSCQNDKFFSFRKEKDACGRQMALIMINQ